MNQGKGMARPPMIPQDKLPSLVKASFRAQGRSPGLPVSLRWALLAPLLCSLCGSGCVTSWRSDYIPPRDRQSDPELRCRVLSLSPVLEEEILALDPDALGPEEVRGVLAQAPAPRIINLHGGIPTVVKSMISFSKFLEGMGYPESSLRNPGDGVYSLSGYITSRKLAGIIAWHYEHEGLRPMIIGHSQGGFQTIRVLQRLAGHNTNGTPVYNPLTGKSEDRREIIDPFTGENIPVTDVSVCFASAIGTGGMARLLPPNWTLTGKLRTIPDSVDAFTGYYIGLDIIGGDYLGFGSANHFKANGHALIRNVELPAGYKHRAVPDTQALLNHPEMVDWINCYTPTNHPTLNVEFDSKGENILYAADSWHDIRKNWVMELQRALRAKRSNHYEH